MPALPARDARRGDSHRGRWSPSTGRTRPPRRSNLSLVPCLSGLSLGVVLHHQPVGGGPLAGPPLKCLHPPGRAENPSFSCGAYCGTATCCCAHGPAVPWLLFAVWRRPCALSARGFHPIDSGAAPRPVAGCCPPWPLAQRVSVLLDAHSKIPRVDSRCAAACYEPANHLDSGQVKAPPGPQPWLSFVCRCTCHLDLSPRHRLPPIRG